MEPLTHNSHVRVNYYVSAYFYNIRNKVVIMVTKTPKGVFLWSCVYIKGGIGAASMRGVLSRNNASVTRPRITL